jgi:hypothetical protein
MKIQKSKKKLLLIQKVHAIQILDKVFIQQVGNIQ